MHVAAPRSINERWRAYRDDAIARDASEIQIAECRRSFYAGAAAVFATMLPDVGDIEWKPSAALGRELCAFWDDVTAGRA